MRVLGWIFLVLLIGASIGGAGYGWTRYQALEADAAQVRTRAADLEAKVKTMAGEREVLEKQLAVVKDEATALRSQVADAAKLKEAAEKRRADHARLAELLKPLVDGKKLEVVPQGEALVLRLRTHGLYGRGSADLSVPGKATLTEVSTILKASWPGRIEIGGHTDDLPIGGDKFRSNWDLSAAYAATAAQFLIAAGLDAKKMAATGYAEFEPVGDNKTAEGQQANRRIELKLVTLPSAAPPASPPATAEGEAAAPDGKKKPAGEVVF
jgi:flagellar motor protein MotB